MATTIHPQLTMYDNGSEEVQLLNDRTGLVQRVHIRITVILLGIIMGNLVEGERIRVSSGNGDTAIRCGQDRVLESVCPQLPVLVGGSASVRKHVANL